MTWEINESKNLSGVFSSSLPPGHRVPAEEPVSAPPTYLLEPGGQDYVGRNSYDNE